MEVGPTLAQCRYYRPDVGPMLAMLAQPSLLPVSNLNQRRSLQVLIWKLLATAKKHKSSQSFKTMWDLIMRCLIGHSEVCLYKRLGFIFFILNRLHASKCPARHPWMFDSDSFTNSYNNHQPWGVPTLQPPKRTKSWWSTSEKDKQLSTFLTSDTSQWS